jgi:hypothetical protein
MIVKSLNGKVSYLFRPSLEEAYSLLKEGLSKKRFIIATGLCRVDYSGRASSRLDWGERVLLIKQDNSLLLHRAKGFEAVNWQPPGSVFSVEFEGDYLSIRSYRRAHQERLNIVFKEFTLLAHLDLVDDAEFEMHLSEEEMYEAIAANPDLLEPGFRILSEQRRLGTGVADFTGYDNQGRYTIIEVKRRTVDATAVKQAYKYLTDFKGKGVEVRGIIAAPSISTEAKKLSTTLGLEFKKIDLNKCKVAHERSKEGPLLGRSDKA